MHRLLGLLPKGHLIEIDHQALVAGYVGQTAIRTHEVVERAAGVLLIDEAYSLAPDGPNDFGAEAIETLVKLMEDHRDDLAVIVAGYPDEMGSSSTATPGLRSHFARAFSFPDYTDDELVQIFCRMGDEQCYVPSEGAITELRRIPHAPG